MTNIIITTVKQTAFFLLMIFTIFACQTSDNEKLHAQKEKELLQKENELLKKELGRIDNSMNSNKLGENQFSVDEALVKSTFMKYLPKISGGRELFSSNIKLGDLNGDNLIDGVVDYGLEPTWEDNGGGGNAIGVIPGLIAFINTGHTLKIDDHSGEFARNFGPGNQLKKISKGVIYLEGLEYDDDDPRCCPSITTSIKIILRNNKLVKIK
jgi:hypothetical protein